MTVVGCGRCGTRIADEFARMNVRARGERGIGITSGVFAVDNDAGNLIGLRRIRPEHKILTGYEKPEGNGTKGLKGLVIEVESQGNTKLLNAIGNTRGFMESDAFMIICGAAGSTGSGMVPSLAQKLKEWHPEKPVYFLVVLPFEDEEKTNERTIYNAVNTLKSAYRIGSAVLLVDNQRFVTKGYFVRDDLTKVNESIAEQFYEMLCAGEENNPRNIGAKTLDAGDIMNTLSGWTVIGLGKVPVPRVRLPYGRADFREKLGEMQKGIQALNAALKELSLKCNPGNARRALYLLAAPAEEMGLNVFANIGSAVKEAAPEAIIRSGDYPRRRNAVTVTLFLSELTRVDRVSDYFKILGEEGALPVPPVAGPSAEPESPKTDENADHTEDNV